VNEYVAIAYEKLGLDASGHEIGTARFIELPDDVFYSICARRLNHVRGQLFERKEEAGWEELVRTMGFLLYKDWLRSLKSKTYECNIHSTDHHERREAILERSANRLHKAHGYHASFTGWREYVCDASPFFAQKVLLQEFPIRIAEADCMRHLFLVSSSGSGKSELCNIWCHAYLERPEYGALFVLDPGGDFALQYAQQARSDRLIYIHPLLDLERTPVINPFEIHGVNPSDTRPPALAVKRVVAQQIVEALEEVVGEGQKGEISKNMRTVLLPCILALLDYPGATLRDLRTFMDDKQNADLVDFGTRLVNYPDVANFFTHSYRGKHHIKPTKDAIETKLQSLLSGGIFANLTCGKSTINLEQAWNERKIVVCNLPVGDMAEEANAFGRLLVCLLQSVAKRRVSIPEEKRIPAHLVCDEVEFFLTRSMGEMLRFSRRYKLIFFGVQQIVGSGMSPDMQKAVIGNSYIKMAGWTDPEYAKAAANLLPVEKEDIAGLGRGEFFIRIGPGPVFKFAIREDYLGKRKRMTNSEWEGVKADQLRRYYRPIEATVPAQAVPPAERPKPALAPEMRGKRPPSRRPPVQITEDENIF
jgi:hypothetical protein